MKIEKISDTQIRCTLSKEDLVNREMRISELAYGSEKAKQLFREMIQQASCEFGFEADDIPLMIEATPVSSDTLVLIITKVEDPDELDTRFSTFTPYASSEDVTQEEAEDNDSYADEILNCFEHLGELLGKREGKTANNSSKEPVNVSNKNKSDSVLKSTASIASSLTKVFTFNDLKELTCVCKVISKLYLGNSLLFKNSRNHLYYLVIQIGNNTPENFNKTCNILSEYGKTERTNYASIAYYQEHFEVIVPKDAVHKLGSL